MGINAAVLAIFAACAPNVGAATMAGLISHESGWYQFAIGDNDARASYCVPHSRAYPCTYADAIRIASTLRSQGHNIDAGLMQVNSANWPTYGLTVENVFDPCSNLRAGSTILQRAYEGALYHFPPGDAALTHALSAYNSGGYYASLAYAADVMSRARAVQPPAPPIIAYSLPIVYQRPALPARAPTPPTPMPLRYRLPATLPSVLISSHTDLSP